MPCRLTIRQIATALASVAVLLGVLVSASPSLAAPPAFKGASASGAIVYFESDEQLVAGDTDTRRDLYERSFDTVVGAYVTRQVSLGPTGGNDAYPARFEAVSDDGERVFFSTDEGLVAADTDRHRDIYMRDLDTATTTLVSAGALGCAQCGNGPVGVGFAGSDEDGEEVFFTSDEQLATGDVDAATDLYVRHLSGEETELVSTGAGSCPACGNGEFPVSPRGISADGTYAYFVTGEALSTADGDSAQDIYAHDVGSGDTVLASTGECPACGNSGEVPVFEGSSAADGRVFFSTTEQLSGTDGDGATDVYARDLPGGPTVLVSGGSQAVPAKFAAAAGDDVFFTTTEAIDGADLDGGANDVYVWSGGAPSLVTPGACSGTCGVAFKAVSADATHIVFSTAEPLNGEDADASVDVYRQPVGGAPVLVSGAGADCPTCGNEALEASFSRASEDTSHVAFTTREALLTEDDDEENDIYLRDVDAGETSLITTSPSHCPLKKGNCGAVFRGASDDGEHVFFSSVERFTLDDGNDEVDVYERSLGSLPGEPLTRLVSTRNDPNLVLGPAAPTLESTDPPSPAPSTTPRILGSAEGESRIKIYTTSDCQGEPVATGKAEQLASPGLAVTVPAASLTSFRATAEADGFVSDCSGPLTYVEDSEVPPGGGSGGGSGGSGGGSPGGGIFRPARGGTVATTVTPSKPAAGIAYVTPRTRISFGPAVRTRSRKPVFRFTDSTGQPGTRFRCKLDRRRWRSCRSPLRLKRLGRGRHLLRVVAINAAGAADPSPVRRAFKVVPR